MWLLLLAAMVSDAGTTASRRKARHELTARLNGDREVPIPSWLRQVVDAGLWIVRNVPNASRFGSPRLVALANLLNVLEGRSGSNADEVREARSYLLAYLAGTMSRTPLEARPCTSRFSKTAVDRTVAWLLAGWGVGSPEAKVKSGAWLTTRNAELLSVLDWADAERVRVWRLPVDEAFAQSRAWHAARFVGMRFGLPASDALVVVRDEEGWTLQRLLTRRDFQVEGGAAGHCVGGPHDEEGVPSGESAYIQASRDGHAAFFSIRNPDGVVRATLEVHLQRQGGPAIVQVQGPQDGPVDAMARDRIVSLFALAGEPLLPRVWKRQASLGGVYVVPSKDRIEEASSFPASYAAAFLHDGVDRRASFNMEVGPYLETAAGLRGTHGSAVGASAVFYALLPWLIVEPIVDDGVWFGFSLRMPKMAEVSWMTLQFRRSTSSDWATAIGPFTPGIALSPTNNAFFPAESPAHAVLLATGLSVSTVEPSPHRFPDLSEAARARVLRDGMGPLSPSAAWLDALRA